VNLLKRKRGASRYTVEDTRQREVALRFWLQRAGILLVLTTSAIGLQWFCQQLLDSSRFPLRYIHLYGDLHYVQAEALQKRLADYPGQNFFSLDIEQLHSLLMTDPWLDLVKVKRYWPDRLLVEIKERQIFARWNDDELLDINGFRFHPQQFPKRMNWPLLSGPDGHERLLMDTYRRANALISKLGLSISHMVQDQRLAWWLTLSNGLRVRLGRDELGNEHLMLRLQRFVQVYPKVLDLEIGTIAVLDMRYAEGFAVVWADSITDMTVPVKTVTIRELNQSSPLMALTD
jgi:cell division protein FtsQ